jgi:hypothetical protein
MTDLTAVYGFAPWLDMPVRELLPYAERMAAVQGGRSLAQAEVVSVGTGRLPKASHEATVARWRRALRGGALRGGALRRPRGPAEVAAAATASGVGFRTVTVHGAEG